MENINKYYFLYKTVNLINNKFYIGIHSSNCLDDKYLGSGIILNKAIKKYGEENFKREIIYFAKDWDELRELESNFITEEFLKVNYIRCYNVSTGGIGGDTFTFNPNKDEIRIKKSIASKATKGRRAPVSIETRKKISEKAKLRLPKSIETRKKLSISMSGKIKSENHKRKIGDSNRGNKRIDLVEYNKKYKSEQLKGTVWIYNIESDKLKYVKKEYLNNYLNDGWVLGMRRKI